MASVEILAWLVLAFADGPDCLVQASVEWRPDGPAWVRDDGCAVHSRYEGSHIVIWSASRWVAIKIPTGARSISYRWGRGVAFINGNRVRIQSGSIGKALPSSPSWRHEDRTDPLDIWRSSNTAMVRRSNRSHTA
jgi:hypothetical protein